MMPSLPCSYAFFSNFQGNAVLVNQAAEKSQKVWMCSEEGCSKQFTKPSKLKVHLMKHRGERPFKVSLGLKHGLSQYFETGCPNRGFIDFCVSKVWYKVHTTNKINPIYLQILLF